MFQKRSLNAASIAGATRRLPCSPQNGKRLQLQLGFSSLNRRPSPIDSVGFLLARGFGHARLRHFFLDAGTRRFAQFFLGFLLHRTPVMIPRPKRYGLISNAPDNPRQTPPYLGRASRARVPAKVKAQAHAIEIDRTWPARITLSRRTKVLHTARG